MKTSAIVCAVLAGSFGLSSVAFAQDGRFDRGDRGERRHEQRADRNNDRRDQRWDQHREARHDDRNDRRWQGAYQQQPHYNQPRYVYQQPNYRAAHRFYRGGYLPYEYRQHGYYVSDWHTHPGLYAPPYGHQWVNVDGEFLLVALATGLIANALLN